MHETETWREVPGFPGFFASPSQKVKREAYTFATGRKHKERVLSPSFFPRRPASRSKSNGPYVRVTRDNIARYVPVAEIMAATFVREDYSPKRHKILFNDHNQNNCAPSNLTIIERH